MRETERDKLDLADKKRQISRDSCGGVQRRGAQPSWRGWRGMGQDEPSGHGLGWQWRGVYARTARPACVLRPPIQGRCVYIRKSSVTALHLPCPTVHNPWEDAEGQGRTSVTLLMLEWPGQRQKMTCWVSSHLQPTPGDKGCPCS